MSDAAFEYPFLRRELLMSIQALSDKGNQREVWVNHNFPPGIEWDNLGVVVNFLFNDSGLSDDPAGAIGLFLVEDEKGGVIDVMKKLDLVFERYGDHCSDLEYISTPEWNDVVASSRTLLTLIHENNKRYGFDPSRAD
ncbi:SCO4402 family protein [Xanthomonas medicagonis]|uniref:SCO4402 family protein n=1 Tax=Xanthomonas medicagonis TaxID=3160841 RepID=UPI003517612D